MALSKYQRTRNALLEALRRGEWKPGDLLPTEPQLMARFNVGRNTLREAIRTLVAEGLLRVVQGSGTYVRDLPNDKDCPDIVPLRTLSEVLILRRAIEVEAAEQAALHRTDKDIKLIYACSEEHKQALAEADAVKVLETDLQFHKAIIDAGKSPALAYLYQVIEKRIRDTIRPMLHLAYTAEGGFMHQALMDAVVSQRPDEAVQVTREHFNGLFRMLKAGEIEEQYLETER
ncbi:FadR/GntR family transcriptional regulator [Pokkaliibacter sp. CJK22405]|uniref:FadR/GntR family transcriptional regulator n=1 Tax=Pokkaliibacter sp. CJK22405 TaxID=3384615 RepID=UPI0039846F2E